MTMKQVSFKALNLACKPLRRSSDLYVDSKQQIYDMENQEASTNVEGPEIVVTKRNRTKIVSSSSKEIIGNAGELVDGGDRFGTVVVERRTTSPGGGVYIEARDTYEVEAPEGGDYAYQSGSVCKIYLKIISDHSN